MRARNGGMRGGRVWLLLALGAFGLPGCVFGGDGDSNPPTPTAEATASETRTVPAGATSAPTQVPTSSSQDLAAAQNLFREGKYGEARDAFRTVAGKSSLQADRADALVGAATAAIQLRDTNGAVESLQGAVTAAPGPSSGRVRAVYLLLKTLNDADRGAEGVPIYEGEPEISAGSALAPYYLFEAARAYGQLGDFGRARPLLVRVLGMANASTALREQVLVEQRRVGTASDDQFAVVAALDALIALNGGPAYRFQRAQLALGDGDIDGYARRMRDLIAASPTSDWSYQALLELTDKGIAVGPGDAGLVYYRRGMYFKAIDVLAAGVDAAPGPDELAFRAFYLGASYEDSGQAAQAVHYYDVAATSGGSATYVHRAKYWAARVTEGEDDADEASRRYVALVKDGPKGEFSEEAAFRSGYVLYKANKTSAAIATWEAMSGTTSARLEYWEGRAYALGGDNAAATAAYRRAVALGPYDLHGLEAARELGQGISLDTRYKDRDLGKPVDWGIIESWLRGRIGGGPVTRQPTPACELVSVGLREEAAAELLAADAVATSWGSFALMKEAYGCGLTNVVAQMAVNLRVDAGASSEEPPTDLLRLSYPIDYSATLKREAKAADVDPLFFAALVRQESFWDPSAGSVAGALGLTQVIPETGEAIANALGVEDFEPSDLFRPAVSLEFGAYYLGGELRSYGNPLLALAAYNAGPGPARRWGAENARTPADLVETIDYAETKAYVTYIYEAYAHYLLAWGG
ncbi:MAG: transglycosylase SLT domain-containing protein [bacterium]